MNLKRPKMKISELIMNYAGDFILDGEDEFEKQQRLNTAVSAWNFACFDESEQNNFMKKYLKECKRLNPGYNKKDLQEIKIDLKRLIKLKIKKYPEIRVQVFNAQLVEKKGKVYVTVASVDI